jgi:hypothetical protein
VIEEPSVANAVKDLTCASDASARSTACCCGDVAWGRKEMRSPALAGTVSEGAADGR